MKLNNNKRDRKQVKQSKGIITLCLLLFLLISACQETSDQSPKKPNVIVILADDAGIGDFSSFGAKLISTPNIDQLAAEGMKFTNAYSNGSVCTPTRYSLLTGNYPFRCKGGIPNVKTNETSILHTDRMTLGSLFQNAGYRTAAIGKWHLGYATNGIEQLNDPLDASPVKLGFDYHLGVPRNNNDFYQTYVENDRFINQVDGETFVPSEGEELAKGISPLRAHDQVDSTLTAAVLQFIRSNKDDPFFVYYTPTAVHTHITPNHRFRGKSQIGQYGDYLLELDHNIGKVMKLLEELELTENTLVVFASDNGGQLKDHKSAGKGLVLSNESHNVRIKAKTAKKKARKLGHLTNLNYRAGKASPYEGGFRIPMIARWPAVVKPGTSNQQLTNTADLFATFAEILDQDVPEHSAKDSFSFLASLSTDSEGNIYEKRDRSVLHASSNTISYRNRDWKLVSYRRNAKKKDLPTELYNLKFDPLEEEDLAALYPERVARLEAELEALLTESEGKEEPK